MSLESIDALKRSVRKSQTFAVIIFIVFVLVYILWFVVLHNQQLSNLSSDWGAFGDFIGGLLNPLIAYLAFFWLTKSILIQRSELELTRKEFEKQINFSRAENARLQLEKYLDDEKKNIEVLFKNKFNPVELSFNGRSERFFTFNKVKKIGNQTNDRDAFLEFVHGQMQTFISDDPNLAAFNERLQSIQFSVMALYEYVILFSDISEIFSVTRKNLDFLQEYVMNAHEVGALGPEALRSINIEIEQKRHDAQERSRKFKEFLIEKNSS
jgi:hypothetical protein